MEMCVCVCVCVEVYLHALLTCYLDGGALTASRPGGLILGGNRAPYPLDMRVGASRPRGGKVKKHLYTFRQSNLGVKTGWAIGAGGVGGGGARLAKMIILWQRRIDHISPSSVLSEQCRLIAVRYSGRNVNTRMVKSPLPAAAAVLCSNQLANTWTFTNMLCLPCLSNRISSACTPNWFYRRKKNCNMYPLRISSFKRVKRSTRAVTLFAIVRNADILCLW